jgi:hypothetical protein
MLVATTVNPAGTASTIRLISESPEITVTVTSLATPSANTAGETAMAQGVAALTEAGPPSTAAAVTAISARASARAVLRAAIRRPGDPAA